MFVKHAIHIFTHTHNAIHIIPSQAVCNKMEIDPISFAMNQIKAGQLTAGTIKQYYRGIIKRFLASDNAFSFMSFVKGTLAYWKQFL